MENYKLTQMARDYGVTQKTIADKDRYLEKEISKPLYNQCKKILGNRLL